jgi:peroxiredoxin
MPAPAFELPSHRGDRRSLAQYLAAGPLLLAFHRGTW